MGQGFGVAFPRRHWLSLPLWCPRGGLPFWLPVAPAFSLFVCPHPPDPLPGGEGGDQSYFMQGASPLVSLRLSPGGTYRTSQAGARRGAVSCRACFARRINAFLPPIPPTPFPGGEGGDQSYFMQGASPLASPRLSRKRHGAGECATHPAGKGILAFLCKGLCPCIRGASRIQNPQQKRLSRFCKTQNPSRHEKQ